MITNKLKINESKTKFIVFRSPQLKYDSSDLSANVGERKITQSTKVRDLGVKFDQFLNFDNHITVICRSITNIAICYCMMLVLLLKCIFF